MASFLSFALLFCSLFALSWIWILLNFIWLKPAKIERILKHQGITGPPYKLLFGNLKESQILIDEALSKPINRSHQIVKRLEPFISEVHKTYGKIALSWLGPYARVSIMDPELVKEVLLNKFNHLEKVKINPLIELVAPGVALLDGEKWATHRRIINPAFHVEKLKRMLPSFYISSYTLIEKWRKLIGPDGSCELDVWPELHFLTADGISRTAFGSSYEDGMQIFELLNEQGRLFAQAGQSACIPGYRYFPTKDNHRRNEIDRRVRALLKDMIKKREKDMKMGQCTYNDLLGLLMESNLRDSQEQGRTSSSLSMTIEDVIEECKLFFFAGQETTAVLLTWTVIVLSMHPEWQDRAREEVLQFFGKAEPDIDGLNNLKTVTMILYEVLRLYPPVTFLVRSVLQETTIGGINFPSGVVLTLQTLHLNRDPGWWGDDAEEFKPERFAGGIAQACKNQGAFVPFGFGPRICLGQNFAMMEAKIALATILRYFSFELSPIYAHAPRAVLTHQPQHGAQIILHRF
ncbi:cytochrome P450 CYP72A616-like [Aristolochia californica]|uniref:cytochrome P450 CYP72A616-like n=1 Tax=Aristolochia californica TaxID=171875 RepID=UPI0035DAAA1C